MKSNPLVQLATLGQSIWLDYIRRDLIADGGLQRLIEDDGLRGMTSNPSIFEKAIADSHDHDDARFRRLADRGAHPQRLLWASTSTKNPDYDDVKYVEALIGPETINTAPLETIDAYRDHGEPKARLQEDVAGARQVLERLPELGIDIDKATQQLEAAGVEKFEKPFDRLMATVAQRPSRPDTRESWEARHGADSRSP